MNDLSGRAAFDLELSRLTRMERRLSPDGPLHQRREKVSRQEASRRGVVAIHKRSMRRRAVIWDMTAAGKASDEIAADLDISPATVSGLFLRGRLPPFPLYLTTPATFEFVAPSRAADRLLVSNIVNEAAGRWECPAVSVLSTGQRRVFKPIMLARSETILRLKFRHGFSTKKIATFLRLHVSTVPIAIERARQDPRFAFLWAELGELPA